MTPPALVRAAIVRADGTLGRPKSYLACDLIDSRRLAVVRATASHPDHPPTEALAASNRAFWPVGDAARGGADSVAGVARRRYMPSAAK